MTLRFRRESPDRSGRSSSSQPAAHGRRTDQDGADGEAIRVLVIDDSELVRAAMVDLLQSSGMETFELESALGATRVLMRNPIHAVVVDINMPGLTGDKLVGVLRENPRLAHLAVVVISGEADAQLDKIGRELDVDAVVNKRDMAQDLVAAVRRATRFRWHPAPME